MVHGVLLKMQSVPPGSQRMIAEVIYTTSPELEIGVWFEGDNEWVCWPNEIGSQERCDLMAPKSGNYQIYVHNYNATDPTGADPDDVTLAVAVVPGTDALNLDARIRGEAKSMAAGQPFDLDIDWAITGQNTHWYGAFNCGTGPANPGNLGTVLVDLHSCNTPHIRIHSSGRLYDKTLQMVLTSDAAAGDTVQLHAEGMQGTDFTQDIVLARDISLALNGGYDCAFTSNDGGFTCIKGSLTLSSGSLTVQGIGIGPASSP
jgi:hypothetical protein